jgi:hypothetical protein
MASLPRIRLYYFIEQGMHFRVRATLQAMRVEQWIRSLQRKFLDYVAKNSKCVYLDCECTDAVKNVKQRNLPPEKKQHAAVL